MVEKYQAKKGFEYYRAHESELKDATKSQEGVSGEFEDCSNCGEPVEKREFYLHDDLCRDCYELELMGIEYGKE